MSRKDAIRETTATIEVKEKPHRSEAKLMLLREILELRRVFNADERKPEDHILSNRYACGKFHPPEPGHLRLLCRKPHGNVGWSIGSSISGSSSMFKAVTSTDL